MGRARASRSGARRGAERLELLAAGPGVDPRALLAEPGDERRSAASSATAPIRRSPNRVSRARTSGSAVRRPDGCGARNAASPPGGTRTGASGRAEDGGDRRANRVPAMPARIRCGDPRAPVPLPGERAPERRDQPLDEDRLRSPQRLEAVDLDLEQPERGIERVGAPGDPRAERRERLEGGLDGRPVRVGVRVDEGRLRDEPVGAPERHPPPDAQRPGVRARVDDRPRIPRPAAQDERAGREGLGGSRPGELEGEVRPVEMEESHRRWSVRDRGGWMRGRRSGASSARRSSRARQASRSPPSA